MSSQPAAVVDRALDLPGRFGASRLLAGSAVYLFANVAQAAILFALIPLLTRYLTPAEYGTVGMFQTFLGALGGIVGVNVVGAAARKFYDKDVGRGELAQFLGACYQIVLASTAAVLLVVLVWQHTFESLFSLGAGWLALAVLTAAATVLVQLRLGQWQVEQRPAPYAWMQLAQSASLVLFTVVLVMVFHQGADGRLLAQFASAGLCMAAALWLLRKDGLLGALSWRPEYVREALRFGVPLVPHVAGIFVLTSIDRLVINAELGLGDVGTYAVGAQLASCLALVFDAANKAYAPWLYESLARAHVHESRRIVHLTWVGFLFCLLSAAAVWWAAPWLVDLVAGPRYAAAVEVLRWLSLGQALGGMYLLVTNYVFYSKRTGLLSMVTAVAGLVDVGLLLLLLPRYGLAGAGMAFAAAMAVRFLLTWRVAHLRHPMPWFGRHP